MVSVHPKSSPMREITTPPPSYISENSFFEKMAGNFKPRNNIDFKQGRPVLDQMNMDDSEVGKKQTSSLMATRKLLLAECSESLGIPGVPNFFKAPNLFLRLFWLFANVICWGGFAFVMYTLSIKFTSYPTVVTTDILMGSNLQFPAVTLCNLNRVQAKRIDKWSKFFGLTKLSQQVKRDVLQESNSKFEGFNFDVADDECDSEGPDATEWMCSDKSNCLTLNRKCDGKPDCDDRSDEETSCPTAAPGATPNTTPKGLDLHYDSMNGIKNADMYKNVDWDRPDWYNVYENSQTDDYRDIYPFTYMNMTEVSRWSNHASDFLVSCSYDQNECDANTDFHAFLHERYGRCITFNSPEMNRTRFLSDSTPTGPKGQKVNIQRNATNTSGVLLETTARTGVLYGLKMNLWLDVSEYLPLISPSVGAILSVHNSLVEPDLDSSSIVIQPGTYTLVGVKSNQIKRLPHPYSDCANDFPADLPIPEEKRKVYSYNQQICIKYCQQKLIYDSCGCYESFIVGAEVLCQHSDPYTTECVFDVYANISAGMMHCDCPMACYDDFYETSLTSGSWPHEDYVPFVIDYIWQNTPQGSPLLRWVNDLVQHANMDFESIVQLLQKEMVRVSIHYETMSFQYIEFYGSYTIIQFIADIGGYIGLFVGVCMMTVFELVDWFFQLTCCTRVA